MGFLDRLFGQKKSSKTQAIPRSMSDERNLQSTAGDPEPQIIAEEVIQSFKNNPPIQVRLACFYSGSDASRFESEMVDAQKRGQIPSNVKFPLLINSSTDVPWLVEEIKKGTSLVVAATDYSRAYARAASSVTPRGKILFFGYNGEF